MNVPGYGSLWQPYAVQSGWDPFMQGAWMWYPGSGYVWVSSVPWGWTTLHQGTWAYAPGCGWCWSPGAGWVSAPSVIHPPPGYRVPRPPANSIISNPQGGVNADWPRRRGPDLAFPRHREPGPLRTKPAPAPSAPTGSSVRSVPPPPSTHRDPPRTTAPRVSAPQDHPAPHVHRMPRPSAPPRAPGNRPRTR
jgi:hypothetical protein